MVHWLVPLILTYGLAEAYKRFVPEETKKKWEGSIKTHHGEAGLLEILAGLFAKSPGTIASGVALVAHDWDDRHEWIPSLQNKLSDFLNRLDNNQFPYQTVNPIFAKNYSMKHRTRPFRRMYGRHYNTPFSKSRLNY